MSKDHAWLLFAGSVALIVVAFVVYAELDRYLAEKRRRRRRPGYIDRADW